MRARKAGLVLSLGLAGLMCATYAFTDCVSSGQCTKLNASASTTLTKFSTCQDITNNCGSAIMIPWRSSAEWTDFIDDAPGCVARDDCGCTPVQGSDVPMAFNFSGNRVYTTGTASRAACEAWCVDQSTAGIRSFCVYWHYNTPSTLCTLHFASFTAAGTYNTNADYDGADANGCTTTACSAIPSIDDRCRWVCQ